MLKKNLILGFLNFWAIIAIAQPDTIPVNQLPGFNPEFKPWHLEDVSKLTPLQRYEDSLVHVADSMYSNTIPEVKDLANNEIIRLFKGLFREQNSFQYTFTKLLDYINVMDAPDQSFRLYNWEFMPNEAVCRYYAVIQKPDGSIKPLVDVSSQIIRGAEDSILYGNTLRWYGCLYYNIISREVDGKNYYFLFGRNINTMNSDKKVIDVFHFDEKGQVIMGAPMFNTVDRGARKQKNRFIYEFQKGTSLSLNFDKESNQIIFDHCESQIGDPAKRYTYIPDGTYDGMRWEGGQWVMQENIVSIKELQNGEAPVDKPIK